MTLIDHHQIEEIGIVVFVDLSSSEVLVKVLVVGKEDLANEMLADALTNVRSDAMLQLAAVDPTNVTEICRLQAIVHVTQAIVDDLYAAIIRTGAQDGGLTMPTATREANKAH